MHTNRANRADRRTNRRQTLQAAVEALETRWLMSVSLENGVLRIYGAESADNFQLTLSGNQIEVRHNGVNRGQFALNAVSSISAVLGAGNDTWNSTTIHKPTTVSGDAGNDILRTGNANDTIYGGGGDDTLQGNGGHDHLLGGSGNDALDGGDGNDRLNGGAGSDTLVGQAGWDTVDYSDHTTGVRVTLDGLTNDGAPSENDYVGVSNEAIIGSPFDDILIGNNAANTLWGRGGHDLLNGEGGDDVLYGEAGNDTLYGGAGNDKLIGGAGGDVLAGGAGIDTVDYSNSPSAVRISQDNQANDGSGFGSEKDNVWSDVEIIYGSRYNDRIDGGSANNQIYAGAGNDIINAGGGNDIVVGGDGNDTIHGGDGNDTLHGGAGDDDIYGGRGNDTLRGEAGHDGLFGGAGNDTLYGGAGLDRFLDNVHYNYSAGTWYRDDALPDYNMALDVRVNFYDSYGKLNVYVNGDTMGGTASYGAGFWNDAEIEAVDTALGVMHRAAGGNTMILRAQGLEPKLWRLGNRISGVTTAPLGWYAGYDGLYFGSKGLETMSAARTSTLNAFAGQWLASNGNPRGWNALSGWVNNAQPAATHVNAGNGWYYRKDARFVSNGARIAPMTDFRETWIKVFHDRAGWAHSFSSVPIKEAFINGLVNALKP